MAGSVLRNRDVSLVVSAVGLSALGDFLAVIPLMIHLQKHTGSGLLVALLFIALWLPVVVLAGPAGLLVDRLETRRLLLVVSLLQAVVAAALAFVDGTAAIIALTTLLGVGFAVAQPAEFSLVPAFAPAGRLTEVNGYVETVRYVGMAAGPALGGLVYAWSGTRVALLLDAATFVVVALAAFAMHARRVPQRTHGAKLHARDGLVFLFRDPTLAVVMTVAFLSLLFMSSQIPAQVFFVMDDLHAGDAAFGIAWGTWFAGMGIGALALSRRVAPALFAAGAVLATSVQGAGLALPTLWLVFAFAIPCYFLGGVAHGTKNVLVRTLLQERVPEALHGRAFAAYNGIRNSAELVALVCGGLLVSGIGARWLLFLAGSVSASVAVVALVAARRRLAQETPTPSPVPIR